MAQLSLALLGPLSVLRDGQPVSGFESAKVRALLAYLAVEADHPHQRDALAGLFWPEQPDQAARNNLRQALANLRQVIGDRTAARPALLIAREQIQFNRASDHSLDLAAFQGLLAACEAHPHRRAEACSSCAERCARAVALYRGEFLEGFFLSDSVAFEEWVSLRREELQGRALAALALLTSFHERRGSYERAGAYARSQIELAPWREEAHRQLMRVLVQQGERSAALAQYELCRRMLAEQLGAEPDGATTGLYEQIRAGELCAAPAGPAAQPALPLQPTAFVGREAELVDLAEMLETPACRLVTIVGPGGVGKTRLALQVAAGQTHAFADGVVFVALAALSSAEFLAATLADGLQIPLQPQGDPQAQLIAALRPKELLLILDNFEQLLPGATLLAEILREASGVTLLVTSRERLDLQWEWVFDLAGLSFPQGDGAGDLEGFSAVQLFVQRARQHRRRFSIAGSAGAAVAEICRLVEGVPLGVELAATSVREHAPAEIAGRIRHALTQLATPSRDVAPRHRSMRAVFDHSWELLSAEERRSFRRLSVFRGGFGDAAAEAVAEATPRAACGADQ
jgi:DNA-binding SARP family transcriptional activator